MRVWCSSAGLTVESTSTQATNTQAQEEDEQGALRCRCQEPARSRPLAVGRCQMTDLNPIPSATRDTGSLLATLRQFACVLGPLCGPRRQLRSLDGPPEMAQSHGHLVLSRPTHTMANVDSAVSSLAGLLRQTPPGQVAKVYHDLRVLLEGSGVQAASEQLRAAAWPVLSEYNTQELITVKTPAAAPEAAPSQPLIISPAAALVDEVEGDSVVRFTDPRAQTSYAFDPLRLVRLLASCALLLPNYCLTSLIFSASPIRSRLW